jgi:hypothetical protein
VAFKSGSIKCDGTVRGMQGEQMKREKAEALGRAAAKFAIVISEIDARL